MSLRKGSDMKLVDGTGRTVRSFKHAIEKALKGPTSIVTVEGSELSISLDDSNDEIDVSDAHEHHTFELSEMRDAIATFTDMAGR